METSYCAARQVEIEVLVLGDSTISKYFFFRELDLYYRIVVSSPGSMYSSQLAYTLSLHMWDCGRLSVLELYLTNALPVRESFSNMHFFPLENVLWNGGCSSKPCRLHCSWNNSRGVQLIFRIYHTLLCL